MIDHEEPVAIGSFLCNKKIHVDHLSQKTLLAVSLIC